MPPAVAIQGLKKYYKTVEAIAQVDLEIPAGEFFGLLGPNGAGKTTLIRSIVGLVRPSAGTIHVFGHHVGQDYLAAKRLIGLSPQEPNIDRFFSIQKTLEFHGGYYGMSLKEARVRTQEVLEQFNLIEKRHESCWRLSGGMQKRVLIARSLMTRPRLLILDEPTAGVDVEQRHELWKSLRDLNADGTTILLTTHYIDEAEELCNRVAIMTHGRIAEIDTPKNLIKKYCREEVKLVSGSLEEVFLKVTGRSIHENQEATT